MMTTRYRRQIKSLVSVTPHDFDQLYQSVMDRYSQKVAKVVSQDFFVNETPVTLLELGFKCAVFALKLRQGYLLPSGESIENSYREQEAWTYAIFTAVLGRYYLPIELGDIKTLLPEIGFQWLQSYSMLFEQWIKALHGYVPGNLIAEMIQQAEWFLPYVQHKNFAKENTLPFKETTAPELSTVGVVRAEKAILTTTQSSFTVESFLAWLQVNLREKRLSVNEWDSVVHRVAEGFLVVLPQAIQTYVGTFTAVNKKMQKKVKKARFQLVYAIKKQTCLLRNTSSSKTFCYYWHADETHRVIKGVIFPVDFFMFDEKIPLNSNLRLDSMNDSE